MGFLLSKAGFVKQETRLCVLRVQSSLREMSRVCPDKMQNFTSYTLELSGFSTSISHFYTLL